MKFNIPQNVLEEIAWNEGVSYSTFKQGLDDGSFIILQNKFDNNFLAIGDRRKPGESLSTKVNVNVGLSSEEKDVNRILKPIQRISRSYPNRLTYMDLSSYPLDGKKDFSTLRRKIMQLTGAPLGTSPLYETIYNQRMISGDNMDVTLDKNLLLEITEMQAEEGVGFMIAYAGMNRKTHEILMKQPRPVVSKGGGITNAYIAKTGNENPVLEYFDDFLKIYKKYNIVVNIGSALRSGSTIYNDEAQLAELKFVSELADYANRRGVQVVIEGPGHTPLNLIPEIVANKEKYCGTRPYFTLGPLPSDNTVGSDAVAGSQGAAYGVMLGISWLCAFTDKEHIGMPNPRDVEEGIRYFVTAAKVGDLGKMQPKEVEMNKRKAQKGCLDINDPRNQKYCSICGESFCPIELNPNLQPIDFND